VRSVRFMRRELARFPIGFVAIDRTPMAMNPNTIRKDTSSRSAEAASTDPHALILTPDGKTHHRMLRGQQFSPTRNESQHQPRCRCDWERTICSVGMPTARGHNAKPFLATGRFSSCRSIRMERTANWIANGFRQPLCIGPEPARRNCFTYDATWNGTSPPRGTSDSHQSRDQWHEFGWRNGTGKWPAYYP